MRPLLALSMVLLVAGAASAQPAVAGEGPGDSPLVDDPTADRPAGAGPTSDGPTDDGSVGERSAEAALEPTPAAPAEEAPPTATPEPVRFRLENGMSVVLQAVPGRRFSAVAMTYDVGSRHVPSGWTGLAHLTEHVMFSGTDVLDEVEVYLRLEAAGAVERNGETGPDRTVFYEVLPSAQLDWALYLESHRMARMLAGLTQARVQRQRDVVLHEGWERGAYGWRGLLASQLYRSTFGDGHPYAEAIVERADDVGAIELPQVQWFFQRYYGPDAATLSVVGGFDPVALRRSIERHFGPIVRSAPRAPAVTRPPVAPMPHERRTVVEIQDDRDQLYVAWPTPALYARGDAELDVLSTHLVRRRDAPLRAALVESGLALEVAVRQRSHELGSIFTVQAVPADGHTVDELLVVIDRVLGVVRSAPIDPAAVEHERARWARDVRLGAEDLGSRAIRLGLCTDQYVPSLENERARYLAVDAEGVTETLARWLPADRRLVLVGHANPRAGPSGGLRSDEVIRR